LAVTIPYHNRLFPSCHKIRVQASSVFQDEVGEYVSLKDVKGQNDDISNNWEVMLQKRLTEEINSAQLQTVFAKYPSFGSFLYLTIII
jgi:hypothetical protein